MRLVSMPASSCFAPARKESAIPLRETDILVRYRPGQHPLAAPIVGGSQAAFIKQVRSPRTLGVAAVERRLTR
jgi:hypothetical protein